MSLLLKLQEVDQLSCLTGLLSYGGGLSVTENTIKGIGKHTLILFTARGWGWGGDEHSTKMLFLINKGKRLSANPYHEINWAM